MKTEKSTPALHWFAVLTAVATFFLIIAGGLVTSTDSGLAVPDWPLSYGQLMPPMVGGIFYEHGHRMVATLVGILTSILTLWLWKQEDRLWVKVLGLIALLAVIVQGILGGITVLYLLPTWVSVSHATLAQSFFSLTIILALITSDSWKAKIPKQTSHAGTTQRLAVATSGVILLQLILGAWMRHSGSGLAIPDFPLSYTNWLPPTGSSDM
ncbi:MAG: COX15/CtaA family protein, partial [bacterium]